jgi:diguanylate cyclase (GGDEF)-like protein/PAS domain S-box-containing protein
MGGEGPATKLRRQYPPRGPSSKAPAGPMTRVPPRSRGLSDMLARARRLRAFAPFGAGALLALQAAGRLRRGQDAAAHEAEERFRRSFEDSRIGMALTTFDGHWVEVNDALCRMLGYTREELTRRGIRGVSHPDEVPIDLEALRRLQTGEIASYEREKRYVRADGEIVWVLLSSAAICDRAGRPAYLCSQMQDLSERRAAEERAERRALQQAIVARLGQAALECAAVTDICALAVRAVTDGLQLAESAAVEHIPGAEQLRVVCSSRQQTPLFLPAGAKACLAGHVLHVRRPVIVEDVAAETRFDTALLAGHGHASGMACPIEGPDERPWGTISALAARPRSFDADDVAFLQAVAHLAGAVVRRRAGEEELLRQSTHDPLTGMPNRTVLDERLAHALALAARTGTHVGVLFLDLDRFKDINDARGHAAGDRVLTQLVPRLRAELRATDTLVRFGGDEFAVVCEALQSPDDATALADRLLLAVARPLTLDGVEYATTASIRIAVGRRGDAATAAALIRDADTAMYQAKRRGGNRHELFDEVLRRRVLRRVELERELRGALRSGELFLLYQPLVPLDDTRRMGSEALLRWRRPGHGIVCPGEFISTAEQSDLILAIDEWVIDQACGQLAQWIARTAELGLPELRCGVNISARHVARPELLETVRDALARHAVAPRHLVVEITESALITDPTGAARTLGALRELGVFTGLDDFGTGYSSLLWLRDFPLSSFKLDRSFIAALETSESNRTIVRSMCELGLDLDLTVVAEGVETEAQAQLLRQFGCRLAQGHLFAAPMPGDELVHFAAACIRRDAAA